MKFPLLAALFATGLCAADPIVIAHRGASGYLPEHTLEAYAFAYAQGAHFIEPDLVMTRDRRFICLHDIHLESTTDVEAKFPHRKRPDGRWYAADFTLDEIRELAVHERLDNRFPRDHAGFQIPTLREMIELVQGLNQTLGKNVGIYPELKAPSFHAKEGLPMERAIVDVLRSYGYDMADAAVFVQCFEMEPLQRIRDLGAEFPTVMLIGNGEQARRLMTQDGLKDLARFANGIGPAKRLVERNPAVVGWAHKLGLVVHPYTMRADDYPTDRYDSFEDELRKFYYAYKVDGVFTDFPDRVLSVLDEGP